ncbi:helix-turn-helix transcriptional regulator [Streptomyces tremellae]|uniref:HTH cro/C1-type domain-containing protein n=1 Tax=Streptomyces tremellae TaxID=1124239 RepID=A0ABP7EY56_9ACTN
MGTAEPRHDLAELVRSRRAELGLSLRKLAEQCVDPDRPDGGHLWKHAVINRLEKGLPIIPPRLPELRALAAGLRLPLGAVQDAAGAQFFGIDSVWSEGREARALVHDFNSLSPDDQQRVRELVRAWGARPPKRHDGE